MTATGSDGGGFIVLRDGPTVPTAAWKLAIDLEARGFTLARDGDTLVVRPAGKLTADERALITRWKPELLQLVSYEPPAVRQ